MVRSIKNPSPTRITFLKSIMKQNKPLLQPFHGGAPAQVPYDISQTLSGGDKACMKGTNSRDSVETNGPLVKQG